MKQLNGYMVSQLQLTLDMCRPKKG